jgi:hypothetical protein
MIRLPALVLVGCVVGAGLIFVEFGSIGDQQPTRGARSPPAEVARATPKIGTASGPLFNPPPSRPETPSSANNVDSPLRDVRLTGVVIESDSRIAIFAVTGSNPVTLSEGQALKGWRLDSISRERVVLSGPTGNIVLEPEADANLAPTSPSVAVQSSQPDPTPGAVIAGAPAPPIVVTPIAIGNLSAPTPVQTQGYSPYSPEYYADYEGYSPAFEYYPYWYPYLAYAVPTSGRFGFGFFHHRVGFGFLHHGGFHSGAFHGGGPGGRR